MVWHSRAWHQAIFWFAMPQECKRHDIGTPHACLLAAFACFSSVYIALQSLPAQAIHELARVARSASELSTDLVSHDEISGQVPSSQHATTYAHMHARADSHQPMRALANTPPHGRPNGRPWDSELARATIHTNATHTRILHCKQKSSYWLWTMFWFGIATLMVLLETPLRVHYWTLNPKRE